MPKYYVGSGFALVAMGFALHLGGFHQGPLSLLDLHSLLAVLMALGLALFNFRRQEIATTLLLIRRRKIGRPAELELGLRLIATLWRYQTFSLTFLWLMLLLNTMVHQLAGNDALNGIGHLLAVMMMMGLYLILLSLFVLMPARSRLQKQLLIH